MEDVGDAGIPFLPEEIWEIILGKVGDPKDLHNCLNTCLIWRKILMDSLANWCFEEIFPSLFPFLPKNEILHCRLVSKRWSGAVDDLLMNHQCLQPFTGDNLTSYHSNRGALIQLDKLGYAYQFDGHNLVEGRYSDQDGDPNLAEDVYRLWEKWEGMMKHERNPIIGGSLRAIIYDRLLYDEVGVLKDKMTRLLRQLGKHIIRLDLTSQTYRPMPLEYYKYYRFICYFLECAPQLKGLRLGGQRYWGILPDGEQRNREDLLRRLPDHPCLKTFDLTTFINIQGRLSQGDLILQRYSSQLRKVQVSHWKVEYARLQWPYLVELHAGSFDDLVVLTSLEEMDCPNLKLLSLCLPFGNASGMMASLLRIINRFPKLVVLQLQAREIDCSKSDDNNDTVEAVAPPSLKLLELRLWSQVTLPFLAHFPSIQYLHLRGNEMNPEFEDSSWLPTIFESLPALLEVTWKEDGNSGDRDYTLSRWTKNALRKD